MRAWGQRPTFMIRPGDEALDAALEARGYLLDGADADRRRGAGAARARGGRRAGDPLRPAPLARMREILGRRAASARSQLAVMARVRASRRPTCSAASATAGRLRLRRLRPRVGMLHALEVAAPFRRHGLGTALTRAAAAWAATQGATTYALAVAGGQRPGARRLRAPRHGAGRRLPLPPTSRPLDRAPTSAVAVPNPASAREEGGGATAGGRVAAASCRRHAFGVTGGGRPLPGLGARAGRLNRRASFLCRAACCALSHQFGTLPDGIQTGPAPCGPAADRPSSRGKPAPGDVRMRAGFAALLVAYVFSQFYRAFLAVLAPVLATDIGATAADLAFASGVWFAAFAAMQIPVGHALDTHRAAPHLRLALRARGGRRRGLRRRDRPGGGHPGDGADRRRLLGGADGLALHLRPQLPAGGLRAASAAS